MLKKITDLVIESLQEVNETIMNSALENPSRDTAIYSKTGNLDSIGLVTLVVELEQKISEHFDVTIVLADEKAMSLRQSPFRTVGSLADYILQLIGENEK